MLAIIRIIAGFVNRLHSHNEQLPLFRISSLELRISGQRPSIGSIRPIRLRSGQAELRTSLNWLCFLAAFICQNLHKSLLLLILYQFGHLANWLCFLKSASLSVVWVAASSLRDGDGLPKAGDCV